jgi:hypothetical protein
LTKRRKIKKPLVEQLAEGKLKGLWILRSVHRCGHQGRRYFQHYPTVDEELIFHASCRVDSCEWCKLDLTSEELKAEINRTEKAEQEIKDEFGSD